MKLEYKFVDGERKIIEIDSNFEEVMLELERNLYNNNHTETGCHISLSVFDDENKYFTDTAFRFEEQILNQIEKERLHKAISQLNSEEQEILNNLFLNDQPITLEEYAEKLGITSSTMRKRVEKLKSKLACIIEDDKKN